MLRTSPISRIRVLRGPKTSFEFCPDYFVILFPVVAVKGSLINDGKAINPEPCLPSEIHVSEGQCPFHRGTFEHLPVFYTILINDQGDPRPMR